MRPLALPKAVQDALCGMRRKKHPLNDPMNIKIMPALIIWIAAAIIGSVFINRWSFR